MSRRPGTDAGAHDAGMTLIELLVAMSIFALLASLALASVISISRANEDTRKLTTVGEETRLGMERLTRELRQASAIKAVTLPQAPNDVTRFTIQVNWDDNPCINAAAADPEQVTYVYDPTTDVLTMKATGHDDAPLLATKVTGFDVQLRSSAWQYDTNLDGITTWQELDASSIGDQLPYHFTSVELANIDLVHLTITTKDGTHQIDYTTDVDLRNQHPNEEPTACP
jgi:prepilin-type N-terminal cleavage/methylation domain-containing protein